MALMADYKVLSGITIDLTPGQTALLRVENTIAYSTVTVLLLTSGATATVQTSVDSFEFVEGFDSTFPHASVITDINWQYLSVNGTPTSSITSNVTPQTMNAPSYIYVKNTSTGGQNIRFSMRGNKA